MVASKVATEVAEAEFDRFVEAMDLDIDPKGWDADDKKSFEEAKRKIVRAIERGKLAVDGDGQPVLTTASKSGEAKQITFYEPIGADLMAMDQKKKNHDVAKMYATLGAITKTDAQTFASMANRDLKVCQAILGLFLA